MIIAKAKLGLGFEQGCKLLIELISEVNVLIAQACLFTYKSNYSQPYVLNDSVRMWKNTDMISMHFEMPLYA